MDEVVSVLFKKLEFADSRHLGGFKDMEAEDTGFHRSGKHHFLVRSDGRASADGFPDVFHLSLNFKFPDAVKPRFV